MTSPITKDNQVILNLLAESVARLTQGQGRKREMEEEKEKVFFVKTKKKKAKKKADVIILDDENCNSKEDEVVKYVKYEVIDCEDQIVRMEDKNKVKIRLGKKKNIREIQNCVISKSEVIREQDVKIAKYSFNDPNYILIP